MRHTLLDVMIELRLGLGTGWHGGCVVVVFLVLWLTTPENKTQKHKEWDWKKAKQTTKGVLQVRGGYLCLSRSVRLLCVSVELVKVMVVAAWIGGLWGIGRK